MTKKAETFWNKTFYPAIQTWEAAGYLSDTAMFDSQGLTYCRLEFLTNTLIHGSETIDVEFSLEDFAVLQSTYIECQRLVEEYEAFGLDGSKYKALCLDLLALSFELNSELGRYHQEDRSVSFNTPKTLIYSNPWGYEELELDRPTMRVFEIIDDFRDAITRAQLAEQQALAAQASEDALYAKALTVLTRDELDQLKEIL